MPEEVSEDEYAVYTAVCLSNVFRFSNAETTFADQTVAWERLRRHYVIDPQDRWSAPFWGRAKYLCARHPEILADFVARNQQSATLAKRFDVPNGFALFSERKLRDPADNSMCFRVSRVGFNHERDLALLYLEALLYGYYLLCEREGSAWKLTQHQQIWSASLRRTIQTDDTGDEQ